MTRLLEAVVHLENGDWQAAHGIAQADPSPLGSWAHGIVHLLEGDRSNAGYWYERAGRPLPEAGSIAAELTALRRRLEIGT